MRTYEKDLSLIIPCYNCEKSISKCINSIKINYDWNIEILLIDDGSTDDTEDEIRKLCLQRKELKYFKNENHGVSYTRNYGIEKSVGKYIMFIDSDDYVEDMFIDEMITGVQKADICICNYKYINEIGAIDNLTNPSSDILLENEFKEQFWKFFECELINPPWNKIFRSDIIKKYDIKFNNKLDLGEDLIFNLNYLRYCQSISFIDKPLYDYVIGDETLSTKFRENYLEIQDFLMDVVEDYISDSITIENEKFLINYRSKVLISYIQSFFLKNCTMSKIDKKTKISNCVNSKKRLALIAKFKPCCTEHKIMKKLILKKAYNLIYLYQIIKNKLKSVRY